MFNLKNMRKLLAVLALSLLVLFLSTVPLKVEAYASPGGGWQRAVQVVKEHFQELKETVDTLETDVEELKARPTFEQDSNGIRIGYWAGRFQHSYGNMIFGTVAAGQCADGHGDQSNIFGSGAAYKWCEGSNNVINGNGAALRAHTIWRSNITGLCAGCSAPDIRFSVISGEDAFSETTSSIDRVTASGWEVGKYSTANGVVFLGNRAGYRETRDNTLHIANNEYESLVYGEFDTRLVKVNGDLEAERVVIGTATIFLDGEVLKLELPDGTIKTLLTE